MDQTVKDFLSRCLYNDGDLAAELSIDTQMNDLNALGDSLEIGSIDALPTDSPTVDAYVTLID